MYLNGCEIKTIGNNKNATALYAFLCKNTEDDNQIIHGIEVKSGSVCLSLTYLSIKTGISVSGIRTALTKIAECGAIKKTKISKHSIIQIIGYKKQQKESINILKYVQNERWVKNMSQEHTTTRLEDIQKNEFDTINIFKSGFLRNSIKILKYVQNERWVKNMSQEHTTTRLGDIQENEFDTINIFKSGFLKKDKKKRSAINVILKAFIFSLKKKKNKQKKKKKKIPTEIKFSKNAQKFALKKSRRYTLPREQTKIEVPQPKIIPTLPREQRNLTRCMNSIQMKSHQRFKRFNIFWLSYPKEHRRSGKLGSFNKFLVTVKDAHDEQQFSIAMKKYIEEVEEDRSQRRFNRNFKNAKTFFSQWQDYIPEEDSITQVFGYNPDGRSDAVLFSEAMAEIARMRGNQWPEYRNYRWVASGFGDKMTKKAFIREYGNEHAEAIYLKAHSKDNAD